MVILFARRLPLEAPLSTSVASNVATYLYLVNAVAQALATTALIHAVEELVRSSYVAIPVAIERVHEATQLSREVLSELGIEPRAIDSIELGLVAIRLEDLLSAYPRASPYIVAREVEELIKLLEL